MRRQITQEKESKFYYVDSSGLSLKLSPGIHFCCSWWRGGGDFYNFVSDFGQLGEGQRAFLVSASSQLPSPENKPSTKSACLGVAYPSVLHTKKCGLWA